MDFHITKEDDITIVHIIGDLVAGKLYDIKKQTNELLTEDNPKIILDFTDVNFMDSSGVGFLINTLKTLASKNIALKIANINATVTNVLKQMKLYSFFEHYESVDEALESFH